MIIHILIYSSATHSTDTFYGILCSGLTDKTKLSFIASNSSFIECVMKHKSHSHNTYSSSSLSLKFNSLVSTHRDSSHHSPDDSKTHMFIDTVFTFQEHSGSGGAIDQTNGGTLVIQRCIFDSCSCTVRGGAVSYRGDGYCIQKENLYFNCSCSAHSGAFDSSLEPSQTHHIHTLCRYIDNHASYYSHSCIEFSPDAYMHSNIYIHGISNGQGHAGTVVNYHSNGPIVYSNCVFFDGNAFNGGELSFMSFHSDWEATYSVKFCFFSNNYNTNRLPYEIYFDRNTSSYAQQELILHCFSTTQNSKVYLEGTSSPARDWLTSAMVIFLFDFLFYVQIPIFFIYASNNVISELFLFTLISYVRFQKICVLSPHFLLTSTFLILQFNTFYILLNEYITTYFIRWSIMMSYTPQNIQL